DLERRTVNPRAERVAGKRLDRCSEIFQTNRHGSRKAVKSETVQRFLRNSAAKRRDLCLQSGKQFQSVVAVDGSHLAFREASIIGQALGDLSGRAAAQRIIGSEQDVRYWNQLLERRQSIRTKRLRGVVVKLLQFGNQAVGQL